MHFNFELCFCTLAAYLHTGISCYVKCDGDFFSALMVKNPL